MESFISHFLFEISSWITERTVDYPRIFTLLLFFLILFFLYAVGKFIMKWIVNRRILFERVAETRRQARAHQHTNHPVEHALQPHKEQKAKYIQEALEVLPKIDPLRKSAQNLVRDLQAANSFEQSEKISDQFLNKYKRTC